MSEWQTPEEDSTTWSGTLLARGMVVLIWLVTFPVTMWSMTILIVVGLAGLFFVGRVLFDENYGIMDLINEFMEHPDYALAFLGALIIFALLIVLYTYLMNWWSAGR